MDKVEVRKAFREDIPQMARVQTESWKSAFADIVSQSTIDKHTDVEKCTNILGSILDSDKGIFYIANFNGEPCGVLFWSFVGSDYDNSAEIVALHSLKETWGRGVGKPLMERAVLDISKFGKKLAYLWVFKENHRARRFYEKCGFAPDGLERVSNFDRAVEVRYVLEIG